MQTLAERRASTAADRSYDDYLLFHTGISRRPKKVALCGNCGGEKAESLCVFCGVLCKNCVACACENGTQHELMEVEE
jgi:hypothetical protein